MSPPEINAAPARAERRAFDRSIVEGPITAAVWKIAWPSVLQNAIGGLQGIVDHVMVGHFVGFTGNAAIGVSWQIFLVVITLVSQVALPLGSCFVLQRAGMLQASGVWTAIPLGHVTRCVLSVGRFRQGRWRTIAV